MLLLSLLFYMGVNTNANPLIPGISNLIIEIMPGMVQFVLRSSPCYEEFLDPRPRDRLSGLLKLYFENDTSTPEPYIYDEIVWYKSNVQRFSCLNSHSSMIFDKLDGNRMEVRHLKGGKANPSRMKHESVLYTGINIPEDGVYFLVMKVSGRKSSSGDTAGDNVTLTVEWRGPHGFLSAVDYPLLRFYVLMCVVYTVLVMSWMFLCIKYFKDVLQIQYWIGAVIMLGLLEKAFYLSEYTTMNANGLSTDGIIEIAEVVRSVNQAMLRALLITISVGWGVVKPILRKTFIRVAAVGLVHFALGAVFGIAFVSRNSKAVKTQRVYSHLSLIITEVVIMFWIFTSLRQTMTTLRMRTNEMLLSVYRPFIHALLFAAMAWVVFMGWGLTYFVFPDCLEEWKWLWVVKAFWHLLSLYTLVVIMLMWRPSQNNQRYAFTPLIEDEKNK